ncbi:MAG: hypothetical protein ABSA13_16000 [Beijerinckiaceae bacterium]
MPSGPKSAGLDTPAALGNPVEADAFAAHPDAGVSEWTASDARGPLTGSPPLSDVPPPQDYDATGFDREPSVASSAEEGSGHNAPAGEPRPGLENEVKSPRKPSRWPVAAGIVLGAAIGAAAGGGSAYYVNTVSSGDSAVKQDLAALKTRLDRLEKSPEGQLALAPLKASLADLTAKVAANAANGPDVAALNDKIASLQAAIGTLQSQGRQAVGLADLKAVQDRLAAIESRVPDLQKEVSNLRTEASAARGDVEGLRAGQKRLEGKISSAPALAVLANSLVERINRGQPFAAEVNALESQGTDPAKIAALRPFAGQGVASVKILADKFADIADGLIAAAHKLPAKAGYWDRLKEGARGLFTIHRPGEAGGDDLASRIAEIKADLAHGDVIAAAAVWNLLPADAKGKPEAAAWEALAKAHAEASAVAHAIENEAIASLGVKKS